VGALIFNVFQGKIYGHFQPGTPKFIFIFLADGAGINHLEITRMYNRHIHGEGFNITDRIFNEGSLGFITTHSADSLASDSTAAATALANGCKAKNEVVGMCADGFKSASVLEVARGQGMKVGIITNTKVYDATPAAFTTHVVSRKYYDEICDAYLSLEPDVLMGGGRDYFLPKNMKGSRRKDDKDVVQLFKDKGYTYVTDKKGLMEVKGSKVLGLFNRKSMSFEMDRNKDQEPSVYDMTQAALKILQRKSENGFVLLVETEHVDSAAHRSDVASVIHELREFDRAVGLAYDFYLKHPRETLILVTSDHESGGLAFTRAASRVERSKGRARRFNPSVKSLEKIHSIPISVNRALKILGKRPTSEDVDRLMEEQYKGFHLAPDLKEELITERKSLGPTFYAYTRAAALGAMVADNTQAYWLGRGHTNQPVFVGALGAGAHRFRGYQDNTRFAKNLFVVLGAEDIP
jgi:alkaline phosphatase